MAVSSSNTKAEILKSYHELLSQLKQERAQNTALQQELEKKRSTVEGVAEKTKSGATQSIHQIRKMLNDQLEIIEQGITEEQNKFEELQNAIKIEKQELEALHKIKAEADSLDALIIANKQAKEKLEKELNEKKEALLEDIEETKLKWNRENEEYTYNLKIQRRKELDEYNEKKAKQEKELAEEKASFDKNIADREKAIAAQEEELAQLRIQVGQVENRLEKAVKDTEKSITERLTKEFEYQKQLEVKDLEADLKLREQMIESLRAKVEEQQALVNTLSNKSDSASQQVKDIAMKAIENSGIRAINLASERGKEEKKND